MEPINNRNSILLIVSLSFLLLSLSAHAHCVPRNSSTTHNPYLSPKLQPVKTSSPPPPPQQPSSKPPPPQSISKPILKPLPISKPILKPQPISKPPPPPPQPISKPPPSPQSISKPQPISKSPPPPPQPISKPISKPQPISKPPPPPPQPISKPISKPPPPISKPSLSPLPSLPQHASPGAVGAFVGAAASLVVNPALKKVCEHADDPIFCFSSIAPFFHGNTDPVSLLEMAIEAGLNHSRVDLQIIKKLASSHTSSMDAQVYGICEEMYDNAISNLEAALKAIVAHDRGTVKSDLDAAYSDITTCDDAFAEAGITDEAVASMDKTLSKVLSNCLEIYSYYH